MYHRSILIAAAPSRQPLMFPRLFQMKKCTSRQDGFKVMRNGGCGVGPSTNSTADAAFGICEGVCDSVKMGPSGREGLSAELLIIGARSRTRTGMDGLGPRDFKSLVSTSFTIRANMEARGGVEPPWKDLQSSA